MRLLSEGYETRENIIRMNPAKEKRLNSLRIKPLNGYARKDLFYLLLASYILLFRLLFRL